MKTKNGQFVWIPRFEGDYLISPMGIIFSLKTMRALRQHCCGQSFYLSVMLRTKGGKSKRLMVHTLVAAAFIGPRPPGKEVDHINREKHDNRAVNLRYVVRGINMHNRPLRRAYRSGIRSGFKGVGYVGGKVKTWRATLCVNRDPVFSKTFCSARSAAVAYDKAAIRYRGKDAVTNKSLGLL